MPESLVLLSMRRHHQHRILLVEDDPFIAMAAQDDIEQNGFECVLARTSSGAIQILDEGGVVGALLDFDLIDGDNSIAVAERLFADELPFCFVTGRNSSEIKSVTSGATAVFSKPADYAGIAKNLIGSSRYSNTATPSANAVINETVATEAPPEGRNNDTLAKRSM